MNNTFNIQRLGLLLKRQWLEFGKIYLITLAVVVGVTIAFYGANIFPLDTFRGVNEFNFREPFFVAFGFLFITVIASNYFAHLGQKPKAVIDLMIPASTFEKFFVGILFTGLLSTISFFIIFYFCDLAFVSYVKASLPAVETSEIQLFFSKQNTSKALGFFPTYIIPLLTTSIFLLGSIYFNRFHYIKTAISAMIFSGVWAAIVFRSGKLLFEGRIMIQEENRNSVNVSSSTAEWLVVLLLAVLTFIFWSITYLRLKEKQV
jgi:hypothetical protein